MSRLLLIRLLHWNRRGSHIRRRRSPPLIREFSASSFHLVSLQAVRSLQYGECFREMMAGGAPSEPLVTRYSMDVRKVERVYKTRKSVMNASKKTYTFLFDVLKLIKVRRFQVYSSQSASSFSWEFFPCDCLLPRLSALYQAPRFFAEGCSRFCLKWRCKGQRAALLQPFWDAVRTYL